MSDLDEELDEENDALDDDLDEDEDEDDDEDDDDEDLDDEDEDFDDEDIPEITAVNTKTGDSEDLDDVPPEVAEAWEEIFTTGYTSAKTFRLDAPRPGTIEVVETMGSFYFEVTWDDEKD